MTEAVPTPVGFAASPGCPNFELEPRVNADGAGSGGVGGVLTAKQADVLAHTASNGRYVTGEAAVIAMAAAGLLRDYGAQKLADGMHYLVITERGRDALRDWRAMQPPPPKSKRRRRSEIFESWMTHCEVFARISFKEFREEVWPNRRRYW